MTDTQTQIDQAANWLKSQTIPRPQVVPALRERFGLSAVGACEAIAKASNLPVRRASDAA